MTNSGQFKVDDAFAISGRGVVVTGRVQTGVLRVGMQSNLNGTLLTIQTIESFKNFQEEANEGDQVGLLLENADRDTIKQHKGATLSFNQEGSDAF